MALLGNIKGPTGLVANYSVSGLKSASTAPDLVFISDSGKEGVFCYDASDTTTADDGLNVFVKNDGKRFKRKSDLAFSRLPFVNTLSQLTSFIDLNVCQFDGSTWEKKTGNVTSNGGAYAGTLIRVSSSVYWERKVDNYINLKWFANLSTTSIKNAEFDNAIACAYTGKYKTVFVEKSTININGELNPCPLGQGGIRLKSGVNLVFDNITIQIANSSTGLYSGFNFYGSSNNTITGIVSLIGDNQFVNEFGHGIIFSQCSNVKWTAITSITNTSGDGLYFGENSNGILSNIPLNCEIKDVLIDNCGRNGISITGGKNLKFYNLTISNINHFAPKCSIDIEVNEGLLVDGVSFYNCNTVNSGINEVLITKLGVSTANSKNISFTDCTFTAKWGNYNSCVDLKYGDDVNFYNCTINGRILANINSTFIKCEVNATLLNNANEYVIYNSDIANVKFYNCPINISDNRILYSSVESDFLFQDCKVKINRTSISNLADATVLLSCSHSLVKFTSQNTQWNLLFTPNTAFSWSNFDGVLKKFLNSYVSEKLVNDDLIQGYVNQVYPVLSAIPTTGTYKVGAIVYKRNAQAGDFVGWICTVSGTPGTWKGFGLIQA